MSFEWRFAGKRLVDNVSFCGFARLKRSGFITGYSFFAGKRFFVGDVSLGFVDLEGETAGERLEAQTTSKEFFDGAGAFVVDEAFGGDEGLAASQARRGLGKTPLRPRFFSRGGIRTFVFFYILSEFYGFQF